MRGGGSVKVGVGDPWRSHFTTLAALGSGGSGEVLDLGPCHR